MLERCSVDARAIPGGSEITPSIRPNLVFFLDSSCPLPYQKILRCSMFPNVFRDLLSIISVVLPMLVAARSILGRSETTPSICVVGHFGCPCLLPLPPCPGTNIEQQKTINPSTSLQQKIKNPSTSAIYKHSIHRHHMHQIPSARILKSTRQLIY